VLPVAPVRVVVVLVLVAVPVAAVVVVTGGCGDERCRGQLEDCGDVGKGVTTMEAGWVGPVVAPVMVVTGCE
jgi:hypothetical protein